MIYSRMHRRRRKMNLFPDKDFYLLTAGLLKANQHSAKKLMRRFDYYNTLADNNRNIPGQNNKCCLKQ